MKRKWWRRLAWRLASVRADGPQRELSAEEMEMVFCVARDEQWFTAVRQVIRDHVADNVEMFARPEIADKPGSLAHESGAVTALLDLLRDLETRRAMAGKAETDEKL